jgi:hypothetical protein
MSNKVAAVLAVASIVMVAGCNRGATNNSTNKAAPANSTNSAAAAATPAPAAGGDAVDAAFLTASAWGRDGTCTEATTFNADGTMSDKDGPGTWTLQSALLTVTQKGEAQPATVSRSGNNLVAGNPANPAQTLTLTPCPLTGGADAAAAEEDGEAETEAAE